jgi:hypothetical protein
LKAVEQDERGVPAELAAPRLTLCSTRSRPTAGRASHRFALSWPSRATPTRTRWYPEVARATAVISTAPVSPATRSSGLTPPRAQQPTRTTRARRTSTSSMTPPMGQPCPPARPTACWRRASGPRPRSTTPCSTAPPASTRHRLLLDGRQAGSTRGTSSIPTSRLNGGAAHLIWWDSRNDSSCSTMSAKGAAKDGHSALSGQVASRW